MRKTLNKIILLVLSVIMALSSGLMSGCYKEEEGIDSDKTQLYVFNFDAGYGTQWLEVLKERFEKEYADYQGENGKVGVQVVLRPSKTSFEPEGVLNSDNHIMFHESVNISKMALEGKLLDISDVVTGTNKFEPDKTIESKITEEQKSYMTAIDNTYYALPHYQLFAGVTYDKDLFDEKNFYFAAPDEMNSDEYGFILDAEQSQKSVGPDGKSGTYDDGLPATNEELMKLCDRLVGSGDGGVIPFVWAGATERVLYTKMLLNRSYMSMVGKQVWYNYSFDSGEDEIEYITGFDGDTPKTAKARITKENAYLLTQQSAKYYALDLFNKIVSNTSYYDAEFCGEPGNTMTMAQAKYINSAPKNKPIAMLLDGSYWYNEAQVALKKSAETYENYKVRNFAYMPMPSLNSGTSADVQENVNSYTMVDQGESYAVIIKKNVTSEKMAELCKDFLRFAYTDKSLCEFTNVTGALKSMDYSLSEEERAALPYFCRTVYDAKKRAEENGVLYYVGGPSALYRNNIERFSMNGTKGFWNSYASKGSMNAYTGPVDPFILKEISSIDYFKNSWISRSEWIKNNSQYFD